MGPMAKRELRRWITQLSLDFLADDCTWMDSFLFCSGISATAHHALSSFTTVCEERAEMYLLDDRLREMNQKELERQPKNAAKHVVQRWAKRRVLGCEK